MRIAVFIKNTNFHSFGGFETQNEVLCEGLVSRGYDVTVFAPQKNLDLIQKEKNGVKYIFIPCIFKKFSVLFSASKDSWFNKSYEVLKEHHEKKPFDIVISQSSSALGIIRRKDELGLKVISVAHGSKIGEAQTVLKSIKSAKGYLKFFIDVPHILYAFFITQRRYIHSSDKIIAVSNAVKTQLIEETYAPEDKFIVIHNGISPEEFLKIPEKTTSGREVRFLYIGRVLREKGLFLLIDVIKSLGEKNKFNFKLNIVGDGNDLNELKDLTTSLGLENVVIFHGKVPYDVVKQKYSESDIMVLPSLRIEGFPMTLVEAMLSSLPIVASDIGGNSDAVDDGETGFLFKSGNSEELEEKLTILLNDPDLVIKMSRKARIKAQKEFTLDTMLDKYEKVIEGGLK
jgi:glycosyltransferase involved in cell wall biosynthesis